MPSITHEGVVELFRKRPALAAEILRDVLGQPVPAFNKARIESADLTEIVPADRRADLVVVLVDEQQRPAMSIVVEVQLGVDPDKPYVWPVYLAQTRDQHRCPTRLLVVSA
jgi:hypothetical protein